MTATIDPAIPSDWPSRSAPATTCPHDQVRLDAQAPAVVGAQSSILPPTNRAAIPMLQPSAAALLTTLPPTKDEAISSGRPSAADLPPAMAHAKPKGVAPGGEHPDDQSSTDSHAASVAGVLLKLAAESLNDIEQTWIAVNNRTAAWTRPVDKGGLGLPEDMPEYRRLEAIRDAMQTAEKLATSEVQRQLRAHPLGEWVKATLGVGEKQGGRLIASIGDPYWNDLEDRPRRGPAELWAYCGYHTLPAGGHVTVDTHHPDVPGGKNVAARRRKGQRANWNPEAKMRAHLIAESCMKQRDSPYRAVYDHARSKHADRTHDAPCPQCGPAGKPAAIGSPLSDGHKHARALREVAKAVLRDLYLAAKEAHV